MEDKKSTEDIEKSILNIFKEDIEDRWRTLDQISILSNYSSAEILKIINQSTKFVVSYNAANEPLVTTRERFRKTEPFIQKLIGAFKNRIK